MSLSKSDLQFLSTVALFSDFSPDELDRVGNYIDARTYESGQVIIWEGRRHRTLFVLQDGVAVVTKVIRDEVETVLARVGPGAAFGELSLIDAHPAAGNVTAETDCRILTIGYDQLETLLTEDSDLFGKLAWRLLRELAGKLRATNQKVQEAVEWGLDAASLDPAI